jgi:vacuolar-type H+-ATPase subunit I/STV1
MSTNLTKTKKTIIVYMTKQEAEKKVYELTEKLLFVKKDFKDVAAGYKEKMREIESEIKAIVEDASSIPVANSKDDSE